MGKEAEQPALQVVVLVSIPSVSHPSALQPGEIRSRLGASILRHAGLIGLCAFLLLHNPLVSAVGISAGLGTVTCHCSHALSMAFACLWMAKIPL
jgi:hypothetical protein